MLFVDLPHHCRRVPRTLFLKGIIFISGLVLLVTACAPTVPKPNGTLADARVYPIGANFFLDREVETWKRAKTLQMAQVAGIRWARQLFPWEDIEPQRGVFTWGKYDAMVDAFAQYGLTIIARVDRPPRWSRTDNSIEQAPPDNLQDYADFISVFVQHYRGRVRYLQIWNEPNAFPEWGNRPVDPAGYVGMLRAAYTSAKAKDPTIKILSAPLAMTLGQPHPEAGMWISMSDLQYLEEMYKAGAADYFDILSYNAFGFAFAPEDPPAPDKLNFQRVALARQIMEQHGDQNKAVWIDEYAWSAAPADMPARQLVWARQSETDQAAYTVRGLAYARANWPWVGVICIWYFRQVGDIANDRADYYFRMVDPDFTVRALYNSVSAYAGSLKPVDQAAP